MKISTEEKKIIIATIFTLFIGYIVSYIFDNPMIFSRCGSIVVCIGIYWGMKDYPGLVDKFRDFAESIKQSEISIIEDKLIKSGMSIEEVKKFKTAKLAEVDKTLNINLTKLKHRFFMLEAYILCLGTLVWGFGDLLVYVA